jgi:hypothetical protein
MEGGLFRIKTTLIKISLTTPRQTLLIAFPSAQLWDPRSGYRAGRYHQRGKQAKIGYCKKE